jgi:hypothetical protein
MTFQLPSKSERAERPIAGRQRPSVRLGECERDAVRRRQNWICYRALAEGAISESKVAELLGLSVHDLNQRMEAAEDRHD